MNCSPFDLKDYFFGELSPGERNAVEEHTASCQRCREELQSLSTTRAVLMSVPDEEPPRRIAFVSDKIFEPRWWQRLWTSGPQLGFASAAMLALAILAHGILLKPAPAVAAAEIPAEVIEAEVTKRVRVEVARAVAASEQQQMAKTMELINARLQNSEAEQRELLLQIADYMDRVKKQNTFMIKQAGIYQ